MSQDKEPKLGISVKKEEDLSEWYIQVVLKAELADYSGAKGFMALRPYGYEMWELIKNFFDAEIKKTGHRNAYFPTLIPESLLEKEAEHFKGFTPEAFWVTRAGNNELEERLAVRPTSETIIHECMRRWIRSWRDVPLLLNVWNSVLRAEIKSTKPFIRTSEFLWQEGHTAHATEAEADKETLDQLFLYKRVMEELIAVPVLVGKKSEKEKFVGALYTTTLEAMMPDGKAVQMGTSHNLGQNFSKPFEIKFLGEDEDMHYVWQTSWGISWRLIGALIMEHGDDKGLVIPPRVAPIQTVVVPILFSSKSGGPEVLNKCRELVSVLKSAGIRVHLDDRENYTPGWKFNEWEMKGVPLRMEIGPRDVSSDSLILARRDNREKKSLPFHLAAEAAKSTLEEIQLSLWKKCEARLRAQTSEAKNYEELSLTIEKKGGFVKANWCGSPECEVRIKNETGADIRVIPLGEESKKTDGGCVNCGKPATTVAYFGRAY
jgi:prolyl-tRNA synthetase